MSDKNYAEDNMEVVFAIAALVLGIIFYYYDEIVTIPWATWRYIDSWIWSNIFFFLPDFITEPHRQIVAALEGLDSWTLLDYSHVYRVEYKVIYLTTWLYLLPTIFAMKRIIKKQRHFDKYKKRLTMDMLIEQETTVWRYNRYLIKNNPVEDTLDVNEGVFACRETVRSGLIRTECLKVNRDTNSISIDYVRASEVFAKQLRYPVRSIDDIYKLPIYFKFFICIFALREETLADVLTPADIKKAKRRVRTLKWYRVFTPKYFHKNWDQEIMSLAYHDYKNTQKINHELGLNEDLRFQLLGDYSYHLNDELDFSYIEKMVDYILPKVLDNDVIKELFNQHAYAETFIRRLLRESRKLGKLSSSQFGYLKILDRQLWYVCNDEGLPGCSFEAIGVKSHFEKEVSSKRRHIFPSVEQAFTDLDSMNLPKNADEYDVIEVPMQHPYAKLYPFNPELERAEHKRKLRDDADYTLKQTLLRQV